MTDTRDDPRYIRMIGLTLLSALLVVASCQVEQLSINIEVEQVTPGSAEEPLPIAEAEREAPQVDRPATEPEPNSVDEARAAIERLRNTTRTEPPPAQAEPREAGQKGVEAIQAGPVFTPYALRPEIRNRNEVIQALMREYPPVLRDAGIGGQVVVWFFISEEGRVLNRRVSESSGHVALDEAALKVADVFRFTPALNRERIVPVWIQLPITFGVQ